MKVDHHPPYIHLDHEGIVVLSFYLDFNVIDFFSVISTNYQGLFRGCHRGWVTNVYFISFLLPDCQKPSMTLDALIHWNSEFSCLILFNSAFLMNLDVSFLKSGVYGIWKVPLQRHIRHPCKPWFCKRKKCVDVHWSYFLYFVHCRRKRPSSITPSICRPYPFSNNHRC